MCARRTVNLRHAGIARSAADPYDVDFPRFGAISGQTKLGIGNYSINYHQNHPSFAVKVPKIDRDRHPLAPYPGTMPRPGPLPLQTAMLCGLRARDVRSICGPKSRTIVVFQVFMQIYAQQCTNFDTQ